MAEALALDWRGRKVSQDAYVLWVFRQYPCTAIVLTDPVRAVVAPS